MPRHLALFALFAMVACAPAAEWERTNTTLSQRQNDQNDCQSIGTSQALDEVSHSRQLYPPLSQLQTVNGGGRHGSGTGNSDLNQAARSAELADYCMRQRGYHAVAIR